MNPQSKWAARGVQVGFLVVLAAAWHFATVRGGINPIVLPPLTDVLVAFGGIIASGEYLPDLRVTLTELAVAFAISSTTGSAIGYMVSRSRVTIRAFDPLFAGLFSIPVILVYPLYVLFFGLGMESKMAIGATISFFPIVLSTIAGFSNVDAHLITAARSMGASSFLMFRRVLLPAAFPVVLTGLRMGFILAFLSILGGETITSLEGLGHKVVEYAELLQPSKMYAYIFFVIIVAFIINTFVSRVEARARST